VGKGPAPPPLGVSLKRSDAVSIFAL